MHILASEYMKGCTLDSRARYVYLEVDSRVTYVHLAVDSKIRYVYLEMDSRVRNMHSAVDPRVIHILASDYMKGCTFDSHVQGWPGPCMGFMYAYTLYIYGLYKPYIYVYTDY
jgi:hypothetical protein